MAMRVRPIGTSLLIELIEPAKRESGLIIRQEEQTVFTGEILNLSAHLEANGSLFKGNTVIFVGRCVDTPIDGQYIIDAEQIIGVLELDEEGN